MQLRDHHFSSARNALNVETVYCSRTCNLGENDQTNPGKKNTNTSGLRLQATTTSALIPKSNQGAMVPTFNGFFCSESYFASSPHLSLALKPLTHVLILCTNGVCQKMI